MTIESRASLIVVLRPMINGACGLGAFGITWFFFSRTQAWRPEILFIGVPLYAVSSTLLDWASSKLNVSWFKDADPEFLIEKQGVTIAELKTYLALVLKFRFMRLGLTAFFAAIAFMFSFYPLFTFGLIYLASFIVSLAYFEVMDVKIPKDLKGKPSSCDRFRDPNIENNPAIIGTAANSIRRRL